jgi:hypothetical protein
MSGTAQMRSHVSVLGRFQGMRLAYEPGCR